MDSIKPFLRWAGSKRKQVKLLRQYWKDDYERYIEPFVGSACLFFSIAPDRAVLSDLNRDLIDTYEVVRDSPSRVYDGVISLRRNRSTYYQERGKSPLALGRIQRAVRFIFLNRNCFNGIYRTNCDGAFNVPFATSGAGAYVSREEFIAAAELLRHAKLLSGDFGRTLSQTRRGDFVYLDPPYIVESRRVFREYGARTFCQNDLMRLGKHLNKLDQRGVGFLVSYADCRESRELGKHWNMRRMRVRRHVAGFSGARRSAYELLISNRGPRE